MSTAARKNGYSISHQTLEEMRFTAVRMAKRGIRVEDIAHSMRLNRSTVDIALEEGQGHSEKPVFIAAKDQEFYDNSILKVAKKTEEAKADKKEEESSPATNFAPKAAAPAPVQASVVG